MNVIDLFAGCGGFSYGFKKAGFNSVGYLEIDEHCINTLKSNFKKNKSKDNRFLKHDIQKVFNGKNNTNVTNFFNDINCIKIDGIIGGPPCQAYSMEGRARDPNKMENDYRNFLFESYIDWLKKYKPSFFVLENVTGMISAKPGGRSIPNLMSRAFKEIGYEIPCISKKIVYNLADFGGPQNRKRVILFGVKKNKNVNAIKLVECFYNILDKQMTLPSDVSSTIKDLPKLLPLKNIILRTSHMLNSNDPLHFPRFHNQRDISIFKLLALDILKKDPQFKSTASKLKLYNEKVGKSANFQKYNVLKWCNPSNTICAHLQKDGLRYIHPDPEQARSITMREAARLQTFPDNFTFTAPNTQIYKMIGNAVAPTMSRKIGFAVKNTFKTFNKF